MGNITNIMTVGLVAGLGLAQAQSNKVSLKGVVLDARSGVLINNATVTLAGNPSIKATTDDKGEFTLTGEVPIPTGLSGSEADRAFGEVGMAYAGGVLSLQVPSSSRVAVDVHTLDGHKVKSLVDANLSAGAYTLSSPSAGLPAGLYMVRARLGARSYAFKLTSVGLTGESVLGKSAPLAARLAKSGAAGSASAEAPIIDTLKVVRDGYAGVAKPISKYEGIYQIDMHPKLAAGDLKIVSERGMPQVNWGLNVDVQVWDGQAANGTQLRGNFPNAFEGKESWLVRFVPGQSYSAWGFIANAYPEDMSAWANGSMHIALKGTVGSIGVTMASANQTAGMSVKVEASKYGYKPDNKWYEMSIPLSDFTGTDFSRVSVYCGLVTPTESDTLPFADDLFYQVDDIYWKISR